MSEAADGLPGVRALVFVASFSLEAGESTAELANRFPGNQLGAALAPVQFPISHGGTGTDLYIQTDKFHDIFAADVARRRRRVEGHDSGQMPRLRWRARPPGRPGTPFPVGRS